ncbi:MAG: hypothetical protein ABEI13_04490, partial [Candidatus Paceibacteria bacterium]
IIWTRDVQMLDPEADKIVIIHHTLRYGSMEQLRWLNDVYGQEKVKRVFTEHPMKMYDDPSLRFIAYTWLGLFGKEVNLYEYLE